MVRCSPLSNKAVRKHCMACTAVMTQQQHTGLLRPLPVPEHLFQSCNVDFLYVKPVVNDGVKYDQIFLLICRLTKYVVLILCARLGLKAKDVTKLYCTHVVCRFGIPANLVMDRDHLLTSSFFAELCAQMGTVQATSREYRKTANGGAERANKVVLEVLRRLSADGWHTDQGHDWVDMSPHVVWQINQVNGVSGYCPHILVYGREPMGMGDDHLLAYPKYTPDVESFVKSHLKIMKKAREYALEAQSKMAVQYNKDRKEGKLFRVGDMVYVDRRHKKADK